MPPPKPFRLVGLMSTYREGPLALGAYESLLDAGLDAVIVWEGPAGPLRCDDAPPTPESLVNHHGTWETDGAKRTAMLEHVKAIYHDRPLWLVLLDGDEILVNGRYLRDLIRSGAVWRDQATGASLAKPDNLPTGGLPLRLIEADGSVSLMRGRVLNANVIRRFIVSNLILETVTGVEMRLGNIREESNPLHQLQNVLWTTNRPPLDWPLEKREAADAMLHYHHLLPPLPAEPHVMHRSLLRHPARAALRMWEQEMDEVKRLGYPTLEEEIGS